MVFALICASYLSVYVETVAVKIFRIADKSSKAFASFMEEVKMMCELKHKNLLGAIAYSSAPPLVITELAERGSLRTILMDGNSGYTIYRGVAILSDVAQGMLFLHTRKPPLIHRDLKSGNILVTNDWEGKVADFGESKAKDIGRTMTSTGTVCWMAPEILQGEKYDEKIDRYSFGIWLVIP